MWYSDIIVAGGSVRGLVLKEVNIFYKYVKQKYIRI